MCLRESAWECFCACYCTSDGDSVPGWCEIVGRWSCARAVCGCWCARRMVADGPQMQQRGAGMVVRLRRSVSCASTLWVVDSGVTALLLSQTLAVCACARVLVDLCLRAKNSAVARILTLLLSPVCLPCTVGFVAAKNGPGNWDFDGQGQIPEIRVMTVNAGLFGPS